MGWVEEKGAVGMSCCVYMGWGGWVGGLLTAGAGHVGTEGELAVVVRAHTDLDGHLEWVGGWVGG